MSVAAIVALVLAGSGPAGAPAPEPGFCAVLKAIIAAEDQPSPFASLVRPPRYGNMEWSAQVVPGFEYCTLRWIDRGRAVSCSRTLAPPDLTAAGLANQTEACLGVKPNPDAREPDARETVFEHGPVRIVIEESCDDRCHVGRRVSYSVEARRKP